MKAYLSLMLIMISLNSKAQLSVDGYTNYNFSGFDVLVENIAFSENSALTNTAIDLLQANLLEISQFNIDQDKIDALKAVPIFMDWNTTTGAAQYHPSESWLIANGYIPEKAMCVEISNITNFINWTNQNQPYMVLHELAHAYHHRELNFNNATITNAFNNAISNNLYTNVLYHTGGGNYINQATAYALSNEKEYFAEITEAYFGLNDYFPFNYNDLSSYDIVGFNATVSVWGNITLSLPSLETDTIKVYPNPASYSITIIGLKKSIGYSIYSVLGTEILKGIINDNEGIDIQNYSDGLYFLKLENGNTFKFIKKK